MASLKASTTCGVMEDDADRKRDRKSDAQDISSNMSFSFSSFFLSFLCYFVGFGGESGGSASFDVLFKEASVKVCVCDWRNGKIVRIQMRHIRKKKDKKNPDTRTSPVRESVW